MQENWTSEFGLYLCSKDEISGAAARYDERLAPEHELENNDGSNALTYRHVLVLVDRFDFASKYVNGLTFLNVLFQRKVPRRTMSDIQSQLLMGSAERDKARIFPWDGTKQEFSLETCATPLQVHPK